MCDIEFSDTFFKKIWQFHNILSDSVENLHTGKKHVEVDLREVS